MKKKILSLILTFTMVLGLLPVSALAAENEGVTVYISVAKDGAFVTGRDEKTIAYVPVTVTEEDPTIDDAFALLHTEHYDGTDGYSSGSSGWITTFWGESASFSGYLCDGNYANGTGDPIFGGEHIVFWFYQDTAAWSDSYTYFNQTTASVTGGEALELTASMSGLSITADGDAIQGKTTGEDGTVILYFPKAGEYIVSAEAPAGTYIVPPVCVVTVTEDDASMDAVVAEDFDALDFADIKGNNASEDAITDDLTLPLLGESGKTAITWTSSDPSVISAAGTVTRGSRDKSVTLTATLSYGDSSGTKEFTVTVPALPVADLLATAADALTSSAPITLTQWNAAGTAAQDTNIITVAQDIVDQAVSGVTVTTETWPAPDGSITYGSEAVTTDVTFALSAGDKSETVSISVTVPKSAQTRYFAMQEAARRLPEAILNDNPNLHTITSGLNFTSLYSALGSSYILCNPDYWTIPEEGQPYLSKYGTVTRPESGQNDVTFTVRCDLTWDAITESFMEQYGFPSGYVGDVPDPLPVEIELTIKAIPRDSAAPEDLNDLMDAIAATYVDDSSSWEILAGMAAYEDLKPDAVSKTSAEAKQNYINTTISALSSSSAIDTTYSTAIIGMQAIGTDPRALYPVNSNTAIDAVARLNDADRSDNIWNAVYTFLAYQQGDFDSAAYEQALLEEVLANQQEDGSWTDYGMATDSTANAILGLSAYYDTNPQVKAALDKAVTYLSRVQEADGTFDGGFGANTNSTAVVVMALACLGIDPDTDARFMKNGCSLLDGLLSFAVADNSGFGNMDNTSVDSYATRQGFPALIAAYQVMTTGEAYPVYNFSANEAESGRATGSGSVSAPSDPSGSDDITVTVTIKGADTGDYWLRNKMVTVKSGATVYHAFIEALEGTDITQVGAVSGYVRSMTKDGVTLGEFDEGVNSGWLYKVNGTLPNVGLTSYEIENGDRILWYYTEDWTQDSSAGKMNSANEPEEIPFTDVDGHWAYDAIYYSYSEGLMSGTGEATFAPDMPMSRAMVVTILYAMEDKPETDAENPFGDVESNSWYTEAVAWAAENGIVSGYSNGNFGPGDPVTREQLAAILWQYAKFKGEDVSVGEDTNILSYTDAFEISDWAFAALQWACGSGLMSGYDGAIMPGGEATRGEMATILMNYLENIA